MARKPKPRRIMRLYAWVWTALSYPHMKTTAYLVDKSWSLTHNERITLAVMSAMDLLFTPLKYTNPF